MKNNNRRLIAFAVTLIILWLYPYQIFAHEAMLEVTYDNCVSSNNGSDMNEMWYILDWGGEQGHISQSQDTIIYYFEDSSEDGTYNWTTDVSESEAQEIKEAYANSMKKWNNVYFYSYNDDGSVTKNKIINVVEGTHNTSNLKIYPDSGFEYVAVTDNDDEWEEIQSGTPVHNHYQDYKMTVYVDYFYAHYEYDSTNNTFFNISQEKESLVRERTGAHELGHILGLSDVDYQYDDGSFLCGNTTATSEHHHELLMGYGTPMTSRSQDITYKDIAGVAITRGFHTDNHHKWLYCGQESSGKYKLLCSICNGVKYVDNLSNYSYYTYNYCGGNHDLLDDNMMAVASYGTTDYYKCKYCRYVAPFSSNVEQNYSKSDYSNVFHKCVNTVDGLAYTFYEEHNLTYSYYNPIQHYKRCTECSYIGTQDHNFVVSVPTSENHHQLICVCGATSTAAHYADTYEKLDSSFHNVYCECGYLIEFDFHSYIFSAGVRYCSCCGYVKPTNPGPGQVIMGEEEEDPTTE